VPTLSLVVRPERPEDAPAIERLEARAFGPGRFARTAYRLREGGRPRLDLGVTASVGSFLAGSVRMSPVRAGEVAFLMLGPLAVDPSFEGRGIGTALTGAAIEAARAAGEGLVILVGDLPYYARFGFSAVPPGALSLPGPVDPARFLWLELADGFRVTVSGLVEPVRA
jgi:predicted N-acetyltransferase YhbS